MAAKSTLREYIESLLIAVVLSFFIITFIAQSFLVQGSSMQPSFYHGQRLLVDKLSYRFREPQRGEVVVFRYPADPSRRFIKRIIGLPGDEILIRDQQVYLNGVPLVEDYIQGPTFGRFGPVVVPPNAYFVLGDNRNNSDDSRFPDVGFVPRENIVGRGLFVYWPVTQMRPIGIPAIFQEEKA
ncbi:MAG: signal peptidase I [Limnochordia bacterium]|jgi:signal peptidase I